MKRKKYKILFYKLCDEWYMICTRTYISCLKIGFKHLFKGHCLYFKIKEL